MRRVLVVLRRAVLAGCGLLGAVAGCDNAGADRVLRVEADGVVNGVLFFDRNGNRALDQASDDPLSGIRVSLVYRGTRDTAGSAVSDASGGVRVAPLPVGTYDVVIDPTIFGDSISVVVDDTLTVTVPPADSVFFRAGVSFPIVSVAEVRSSSVGRKVFVEGVALGSLNVFGDTTVHIADTSGAIRVTRVRPSNIVTGDSVRLLGIRNQRDGQETLDDVTVLALGIGALPPAELLTTETAASADSGRLDASLVRVRDVVIGDTASVLGDFVLTVDDGSGAVSIVLDQDANLDEAPYEPGVRIDATGLLVPDGSGGWVLKPRTDNDLTVR